MSIGRRDAALGLAAAGATFLAGCAARAQPAGTAPVAPATPKAPTIASGRAFSGSYETRPLPFRPGSLRGLSERLITSHHEKNYGGAVRNLNRVEGELAKLGKDAPGFVVGGLEQSHLIYRNSAVLHEHYFGNLGGSGKPAGPISLALAGAYGSHEVFETHFRAVGASLGGGSGWVVLGLELDSQRLFTAWSGNHSQVLAGAVPLLVMDMYEHSYQLDYGADFARYVDAFFANVNWDEVDRRFDRAKSASAALRA